MLSANAKAVHPVNRPSSRTCLALPKLVNDRRNCAKKKKNAASDNLIYVALFWRDISGYTGYWQGLKIMERFNVLYIILGLTLQILEILPNFQILITHCI